MYTDDRLQLNTIATCAVCQIQYYPKDHIGTHKCREHASSVIACDETTGDYFWPCCNTPSVYSTPKLFYSHRTAIEHRGCIPCDHKMGGGPYCRRAPLPPRPAIGAPRRFDLVSAGEAIRTTDEAKDVASSNKARIGSSAMWMVYMYDRKALEELENKQKT
jgi:hypothetical protein